MKLSLPRMIYALTLAGLGVASCSSGTTYDSAYYDSYYYYGYYPADVYYSTYYWSDPYYYYQAPYGTGTGTGTSTSTGTVTPGSGGYSGTGGTVAGTGGTTGAGGSGGTTGNTSDRQSLGDLIRAMARGENICSSADQVAATARLIVNPCPTNGSAMLRTGGTIAFNGCQLSNGGRLDGTIDVQSTRTASGSECGATTMIALAHSATITNLTYTGPNGRRLVFPAQTGAAMVNYVNGQAPTALPAALDGRMQVYGVNNALLADHSYSGQVTITAAQDRTSYTVDGSLTLQDQTSNGTTTLTANGLSRNSDCCRPTGGALTMTRTGDKATGPHTWSFGPSCGSAKFDETNISIPACL